MLTSSSVVSIIGDEAVGYGLDRYNNEVEAGLEPVGYSLRVVARPGDRKLREGLHYTITLYLEPSDSVYMAFYAHSSIAAIYHSKIRGWDITPRHRHKQ